ncbi:MAG TPA: acyltransferase, partial [Chiayiivirga sp.]|nr:acyltransferase [Chiayiivirga sp.]
MSTLAYRSDIDGLRAIAVLAVVLYHYGIGPIHGGFVGVDIFFVISGYLITGIIHKEIGEGRFTFAAFYERRIRRIFPALFMVLAATLAVGCWLLLPSDLLRLGNAALATLVFGSNVLFWRQSGYFDTSAEYNPLLHTWSLAVEEQFYIGLPILLILLQRFAKGQMRPVLIAGAVLSFALCVGMQSSRPAATFFLSPFRAWELLLGGWLAVGSVPLIRSSRIRVLVSVAALALL